MLVASIDAALPCPSDSAPPLTAVSAPVAMLPSVRELAALICVAPPARLTKPRKSLAVFVSEIAPPFASILSAAPASMAPLRAMAEPELVMLPVLAMTTTLRALVRSPVAESVPPSSTSRPRPRLASLATCSTPLRTTESPVYTLLPLSTSVAPLVCVRSPPPEITPESCTPFAPETVSPPVPRTTSLASERPGTAASSAPPFEVTVPLPSDSALSITAVAPDPSVACVAPDTPFSVQVPLATSSWLKFRYLLFERVPVSEVPCCRRSVLLPPKPPSTMPAAAKLTVTAPMPRLVASAVPPAALTDESVVATNRLVLLAPRETLPFTVPELVKVLPPAEEPNPTRPVMVPELSTFTRPPP